MQNPTEIFNLDTLKSEGKISADVYQDIVKFYGNIDLCSKLFSQAHQAFSNGKPLALYFNDFIRALSLSSDLALGRNSLLERVTNLQKHKVLTQLQKEILAKSAAILLFLNELRHPSIHSSFLMIPGISHLLGADPSMPLNFQESIPEFMSETLSSIIHKLIAVRDSVISTEIENTSGEKKEKEEAPNSSLPPTISHNSDTSSAEHAIRLKDSKLYKMLVESYPQRITSDGAALNRFMARSQDSKKLLEEIFQHYTINIKILASTQNYEEEVKFYLRGLSEVCKQLEDLKPNTPNNSILQQFKSDHPSYAQIMAFFKKNPDFRSKLSHHNKPIEAGKIKFFCESDFIKNLSLGVVPANAPSYLQHQHATDENTPDTKKQKIEAKSEADTGAKEKSKPEQSTAPGL